MADLQVTLLGQFRVHLHGTLVTAIDTSRLQSLFAFLALHRSSPISRHQLAFALWPDTGESQALGNLRALIHRLRHAVPEMDGLLAIDAQSIWLRPDADVDVDATIFAATPADSADADELTHAAARYTGDLLPSCYDEWIGPERECLHEHALALLTRLVSLREAERSYLDAIGHARQLLRLDPLQETTYRTLMRLYALVDDRASALRMYHVCVSTLHDELGVEPAQATQEQYTRLLAETQAPASYERMPGRLPLLGRQAEWTTLQKAWLHAAGGHAGCAVVLGEAGIGKTRLAEELVTWAARQGIETATAHCYAGAGSPAYAPIVEWLRSPPLRAHCATLEPVWLSEIGRLLPEMLAANPSLAEPVPLTSDWQRQRLFDALTHVVIHGGRPLLLALDDAQWCDATTLEWLGYLFEHEKAAPLMLVLTARSEEIDSEHPVNTLLRALRRAVTTTEIGLGPLSPDETAALAQAATGGMLGADAAARLHQETEGYPLFVVEMARLFAGDGGTAGMDSNPDLPLPPRMTAVLESRLAQLSPPARNLAGLSAVIGRQFSFAVLAAIWEEDELNLVHNLDELWQRRIVREHGTDSYDFTHGKLRDVAYAALSAARRRLTHRRIAEALLKQAETRGGATAAQVAIHYEQAGDLAQAAIAYRRAAELAVDVYANHDAIRFYQQAITLAGSERDRTSLVDDTGLAEMHERLGAILYRLTRIAEARAVYEQALALLSPGDVAGHARMKRLIGNTWRDDYCYPEAMPHYAAALALLEQAGIGPAAGNDSPDALARPVAKFGDDALLWQEWIAVNLDMSLVYYWQNRVADFDRLDEPLQRAVESFGTPGQQALYWQRKGNLAFRANRCVATDEIVSWHRRSLEAALDGGDPAEPPYSWFMFGFALLWNRQPAAALEPMQRGLAFATERGDASLRARCLTYLTIAQRQLGHVEAVERLAAESLAVAEAAHMPEYVGTAQANRCWLAWRAGDAAAASAAAQAAHAAWSRLAPDHASLYFQWTALLPELALAVDDGATADAVEHARRLLAPTQQALPESLASLLAQAISADENGIDGAALPALSSAVDAARTLGYL